MAPLHTDESVSVPLTEFVRQIAREAAKTVIEEHIKSCPMALRVTAIEASRSESKWFVAKIIGSAGVVATLMSIAVAIAIKVLGV